MSWVLGNRDGDGSELRTREGYDCVSVTQGYFREGSH